MQKIYGLLFVIVPFIFSQDQSIDPTQLIRQEVAQHTNTNITQKTHPFLYGIVEECVVKTGIAMPRYISLYYAEYNIVDKNGIVYRDVHDILAYVDALGDLYICREILTDLSYQEIKAIIAIAVAEKSTKRAEKAMIAGLGTFGATIVTLCTLNAYYDLRLGRTVNEFLDAGSYHNRQDNLKGLIWLLIAPSLVSAALVRNYLQKSVDVTATKIASIPAVIQAIGSLENLQNMYRKENFFSRIADYLKLKPIFNTIFYPVRPSTPEERIEYLQRLHDEPVV